MSKINLDDLEIVLEKQLNTWFAKVEIKDGWNTNRLVYEVDSKSNNYQIWYNINKKQSFDGFVRTRVRYFYNKDSLPKKWKLIADYLEKEVENQRICLI